MQLHLEPDELNLLTNILLERVGTVSTAQAPSSGSVQSDRGVGQSPRFINDVLDKVLARDLRLDSDELEEVADLLRAQKRTLTEGIAQPENAAHKIELQQKLGVLERLLERVTEACVMF
ncbi:MAG: hypothetical protein ABSD63_16885 [Candidatus Korobacteraceae bacterium]|jgi:hypothetical protein